jgi:hypothetical protein
MPSIHRLNQIHLPPLRALVEFLILYKAAGDDGGSRCPLAQSTKPKKKAITPQPAPFNTSTDLL